MARAPVTPSPRQRVWDHIRRLRDFTSSDLVEADLSYGTVRDIVLGFKAAGIVAEVGEFRRFGKGALYRLVDDRGSEAPRVSLDGKETAKGRPQEQMWRTIKMLGEFDAPELALNASTDEHPVSEIYALSYVKHLMLAGYLIMVRSHRPGTKHRARYRFVPARNTGPKPPSVLDVRTVYDANERRIVWTREIKA